MVLEVLRITGTSMAPTFSDGDFVIALSDDVCARPPALGSVVIIRHPGLGLLVKRVLEVDNEGRVKVGGDNPMSVSSRELGRFESSQIFGRVLLRFPKQGFPSLVGRKAA